MQRVWMIVTACLVVAVSQDAFAEIAWHTQLKAAHAQAQMEGKLLLLHFYDDNCVWCDRLEQGAFQSPEVIAAIEKNYIPVKVHAGKNPAIASTFKVTRYPTDVIVTTQGQALGHTVSPQDPSRYVAMLAQATQPVPNATQVAAAPVSPAPGDQLSTNSTSPGYQTASMTLPSKEAGIQATAVSHRTGSSEDSSASKTTRKSAAELELAMDGYCAVTVIEQDRWVEGNAEFGVVHLGRLYLFADKGAMDKFLKNPEPYTPVLNGIDVVRFFEEHKIVPGNRDWGLKDPEHNRMFFFADEAALNHFYNQHTRYTDAAMMVMQKAIKDANP